jgi:hypothetical protein
LLLASCRYFNSTALMRSAHSLGYARVQVLTFASCCRERVYETSEPKDIGKSGILAWCVSDISRTLLADILKPMSNTPD